MFVVVFLLQRRAFYTYEYRLHMFERAATPGQCLSITPAKRGKQGENEREKGPFFFLSFSLSLSWSLPLSFSLSLFLSKPPRILRRFFYPPSSLLRMHLHIRRFSRIPPPPPSFLGGGGGGGGMPSLGIYMAAATSRKGFP